MATTYKVLGQVNPSASTLTTLYTATAAAIITTLSVCNKGTGTSLPQFRVAVRPAAAAIANQHYLVYDKELANSETVILTLGITLANTDVVSVYANTADFAFTAFGGEIT